MIRDHQARRSVRLARHGVALLCASLGLAVAAAPDSAAIIGRLAHPAPSSIAFVEVRFSPLLAEPLVVSGTLDYEGAGALRRRVEQPYAETTTIRGDSVAIERAGERERTFALRRAPELRGFVTTMLGILTGDSRSIDDEFTVATAGTDERWTLTFAPSEGRIRQRLRAITVTGAAAQVHCFVVDDTAGGASVTLLGAAATRALQPPLVRDELVAACAAE